MGTSITLRSPIAELCGNCHGVFPHPLGIPHLRIVKDDMLAQMVACELLEQFVISVGTLKGYLEGGGRLPHQMRVDPDTREATCSTCHNPHEKGLFPANSPYGRGAEGDFVRNYRLRMPKEKICQCCHRI